MAPVSGMPAVADNPPHFTNHCASSSPRSRFCAAVRNGDATAVKKLLGLGQGDVNTIDPATGMTALLLAALHGHADIVLLLCRETTRRDLHRTDAHGNSALMLAAGAGHADVVTLLLDRGATVDQEDKYGNTALMQLAASGQTGIMQGLIDAGADPAHRNHAGQTAAELAELCGHHFVAAMLSGSAFNAPARAFTGTVTGNPACTNAAPETFLASSTDTGTRSTSFSSLHEAIAANDLNALKRLLTTFRHSGHDVPRHLAHVGKLDTRDPFFADQEGTLLMAAAHQGHEMLFPVLLAAGAEIDQAMPDGWTALLFAAQQGHVAAVRALIALGATDQVDADGDTALIFAARNGDTPMMELLLQAGVDTDHKNTDGDTALTEAAWRGNAHTVQALLNANADPDQSNEDCLSALLIASRNGHTTIARMLLQAGARRDQVDADGTTALVFAAAQGHAEIVDMLLAEGADPHRQDKEGLSALAYAHARRQDAVGRSLMLHLTRSPAATVSSTASAEMPCPTQDLSAKLMKAIERNNARAVKRCLHALQNAGKDVVRELDAFFAPKNSKDPFLNNSRLTPLMLAAYYGYADVIVLLIGAGATVNKTDKESRSTRAWVLRHAQLQAGANVGHSEAEGWTALMVAAMAGRTASARMLLAAGAVVDKTGDANRTALQLAARHGSIEILQALIGAGAEIDMTVNGGQTALMWAAAQGHIAIVQALLDAGADPHLKTDKGDKAVDYAKYGGHESTVAVLRMAAKTTKRRKNPFWKSFG